MNTSPPFNHATPCVLNSRISRCTGDTGNALWAPQLRHLIFIDTTDHRSCGAMRRGLPDSALDSALGGRAGATRRARGGCGRRAGPARRARAPCRAEGARRYGHSLLCTIRSWRPAQFWYGAQSCGRTSALYLHPQDGLYALRCGTRRPLLNARKVHDRLRALQTRLQHVSLLCATRAGELSRSVRSEGQ